MVLCVDTGAAHDLKWCPLPSNDKMSEGGVSARPRKLGILAGTFHDGSLSIFAVPFPSDIPRKPDTEDGPIFLTLQPTIRINLDDTTCWTLDWGNSEVVAVGCTNGCIAVYNLHTALNSPSDPLFPTHYFPVHQSAIRAIAWVNAPCAATDGTYDFKGNPCVIASGGYDGVECVTDIRDLYGSTINRTRDVVPCITYSQYQGGPITVDHENMIKAYSLSPTMLGRGHALLEPEGPSWSLSASAYHPQLAVGCSDGSCLTTNMARTTRRGNVIPFFVHKVFQIDYNQHTKEYRMLERFLPTETQDRPSASRTQAAPVKFPGNGAWPSEVAVTRVVWHDGAGLAGASWLASASASGLCRVDWLEGRWIRDRVPYGGLEVIRGEKEDEGVEDDDE